MASKDDLKKIYEENIIPLSLTGSGTKDMEIIDIVSNYPWSASTLKGGISETNKISFQHNIPFCYVVEHKQTVNSNIANFINTIKIGLDSAAGLVDDIKKTANSSDKVLEAEDALGAYVKEYQKGLAEIEKHRGTAIYDFKLRELEDKLTYNYEDYANVGIGKVGVGTRQHSALYAAAWSAATTIAESRGGIYVDEDGEGDPSRVIQEELAKARANPSSSSDTTESGKSSSGSDDLYKKLNTGSNKMLGTLESLKNQYQKHVERFLQGKDTTHLGNSKFLSPYQYLYYTEKTNKYYVFPVVTPTELLNLNHSYGTDSKGFDIFGVGDFVKSAADIFAGGTNLLNFFNSRGDNNTSSGMEEQYAEMAKSFSFSPDGQELTINFPLFNTTKRDAWKTNYRFLAVFLLRNLPFKVSAYSYKPPLLYDIVVPGTNHLPLCYVSSINIQHYGLIRHLKCDSFYHGIDDKEPKEMQVPVPEAWFVSIRFKSLLSNSSNLMIDLINSPITITSKQI